MMSGFYAFHFSVQPAIVTILPFQHQELSLKMSLLKKDFIKPVYFIVSKSNPNKPEIKS
jgi:hypothetical protein